MHVTRLRPREGLHLDEESLAALIAGLGPHEGNRAICTALETMAEALVEAEAAWHRADFDMLAARVSQIAVHASRVGMPKVARVAREIVPLCAGFDHAALSAVVARLMRLTEAALFDIWEVEGLSL